MEIIFLLGSAQAFFFGFLLLGKDNNGLHQKLLFFYFGIIGLVLLEHFLFLKAIVFIYPHLLGLTYTLPILAGPILLFYTKSLISQNDLKLFPAFFVHSIPFLALTIYFAYDFYFLSPTEKLLYYEKETRNETSAVVYIAEFFISLSVPVYSIISILLLKKHLKHIKQSFSNTLNLDLHWLKIVLVCMLFISFVSVSMALLSDHSNLISYQNGDNVMYAALSLVIYFLGYYGIKQKPIFSNANNAAEKEVAQTLKLKYANSSLKHPEKENLINRLTDFMDTEKPFMCDELTLNDLANRLEILPNNLSQLINEGFNKNFYEFVNEYRVNEVKKMLADPKYTHYSLLGIAFECGFSSKSTFNSVFKKFTRKTPSEYRKSLL